MTLNPRDHNFALSRFIAGNSGVEHMQTKDLQASEEKRAYFRLLRYLVTDELQAYYREEQARPLQPRFTDFLKEFGDYEPSKIQ